MVLRKTFNPNRMVKAMILKQKIEINSAYNDYCPKCGIEILPEDLSNMECIKKHNLNEYGLYTRIFRIRQKSTLSSTIFNTNVKKERTQTIVHGYTLYGGFHTHNQIIMRDE